MVLPSAAMLTLATEVVGEITALIAIATPRPRRSVPRPRSSGFFQFSRSATRSSRVSSGAPCDQRAGGLRPAFAQHVLAAELDRVELERARDHVGVALIGPDQLRNAEAAQRPRRRQVGVERVGIDPDIVDVVGPRCGEAGFLRHPRSDIRIGAAVPPHLAFARGDPAVLVEAGLDAERARVLGDGVELLLHGERDLHRPAHDHRERGRQRFHLDVELAAKTAAQIRHLDAHPVLRPAEQPRDLGAHERGALRAAVDRDAGLLPIGDRSERLERQMQDLLGSEGVLEHVRRFRERPARRRRAAA